jgi:hypothetical protein
MPTSLFSPDPPVVDPSDYFSGLLVSWKVDPPNNPV